MIHRLLAAGALAFGALSALAAVPADSSLAARYLEMLEAEENRIADLGTRRQAAEQALKTLTEAFSTKVGAL